MEKKSWKATRDVAAGAFSMDCLELVGEEDDDDAVPAIPPPQTPMEPMEYLSRSWSVSASEISKILVGGGGKKSSAGVAAASRLRPEVTIPELSVLATTSSSIVPLPCHHQQHVINLMHISLHPLCDFIRQLLVLRIFCHLILWC